MANLGWDVIGVANDEADFSSRFKAKGLGFIHLDMDHKGKNPVADLALILRLRNLYRRELPSLVHHFTIKPAIYGSIGARCAGVPFIVNTITGLGYAFEKKGALNAIVSLLYKYALKGHVQVIFQNPDNRDVFLSSKLVCNEQSHIILGSGVDCQSLRPVDGNSSGGPTFLLVGRMLWTKGVAEYVAAAEILKKEYPDCNFIMVGGVSGGGAAGNPQVIAEEWLQSVQTAGKVQWLGRIPFEKVVALMDSVDAVVLPSYSEGVPRSLIEATAKGKAIVATDVPGCREVVVDGLNGYLVPPRDPVALAAAMRRFIGNPALVRRMGQESRRRAELLFDEKIIIDQTRQVYTLAGAR